MGNWRDYFKGRGPRLDKNEEFYPNKWELEKPVLLNLIGPVAAAFVGARVLRALALRGGTKIMSSSAEKLEELAAKALPKEVLPHCEAEAEAILEWLVNPPPRGEGKDEKEEFGPPSGTPELDMMVISDLESRLSVAQFALEEGYDLELEYFDEESGIWPRVRVVLIGIEGGESEDFEKALRIRDRSNEWVLELKYVRWLMPVNLREWEKEPVKRGADILRFPVGGDEE